MSSKPEIAPATTAKKSIAVGKKVRKASASKLIVVLGMHRSGTSVAARSMKALGAELGDNLMKPVANNNEKGFWEDLDFNRLNERVLAKAKSGWHYLHPINTALFEKSEYAAERIEAAALLKQKIQTASVFAVKDPRTAVLLPFWRCVMDDLDIEPTYLITLRNPLETAESLRKRDGFDRHKSLVLWLKYTYAAISCTEDSKRVFVSYQNLMSDPHGQLERMADGLELMLPPSESPALTEFVADFLDASLHHNRVSDNELRRDETIPAPIPRLYELVHDWCFADPGTNLILPDAVTKEVEAYFESRDDFLGYSDRVEETLIAVRKQAKQAETRTKELDAKLVDLKTQSDQKIEQLEATSRQQSDDLKTSTIRAAIRHNVPLLTTLSAAQADSKTLATQLEQSQTNLQMTESHIGALQTQLSDLTRALSEAIEESARTADERDALRIEVSDLTRALSEAIEENIRAADERDALQADVLSAKSRIDQLQGNLADYVVELKRAKAQIGEHEGALKSLKQSNARYQEQRDQVQSRLDAENLPVLKARLADSTAKLERLSASSAAYEAVVADLRKELRLQRASLLELRCSTSWRLTRPVRDLKLLLTRSGNLVSRIAPKNKG